MEKTDPVENTENNISIEETQDIDGGLTQPLILEDSLPLEDDADKVKFEESNVSMKNGENHSNEELKDDVHISTPPKTGNVKSSPNSQSNYDLTQFNDIESQELFSSQIYEVEDTQNQSSEDVELLVNDGPSPPKSVKLTPVNSESDTSNGIIDKNPNDLSQRKRKGMDSDTDCSPPSKITRNDVGIQETLLESDKTKSVTSDVPALKPNDALLSEANNGPVIAASNVPLIEPNDVPVLEANHVPVIEANHVPVIDSSNVSVLKQKNDVPVSDPSDVLVLEPSSLIESNSPKNISVNENISPSKENESNADSSNIVNTKSVNPDVQVNLETTQSTDTPNDLKEDENKSNLKLETSTTTTNSVSVSPKSVGKENLTNDSLEVPTHSPVDKKCPKKLDTEISDCKDLLKKTPTPTKALETDDLSPVVIPKTKVENDVVEDRMPAKETIEPLISSKDVSAEQLSPFVCSKETSSTPQNISTSSTSETILNDSDTIKKSILNADEPFTSPNISLESSNPFRKHVLYVEILYKVNKDCSKEVSQIVCEDIMDASHQLETKRISDVSSGILGDISKNTSPSSSVSGSGPFALPNRFSNVSNASSFSSMSRMSTSSSSSAFSSASGRFSHNLHREDIFLIPDLPISRQMKDKSFHVEKKISNEQIDQIKTRWSNTEQLLQILHTIENSSFNGQISETNSPKINLHNSDSTVTNENIEKPVSQSESVTVIEKKLPIIEEVSTPKSEKRSTRKRSTKADSESIITTPSSRPKSIRKTKRSTSTSSTNSERAVTPDRSIGTTSQNIVTGQPVFGRWTDRKYYSGVVAEHVKDNKWMVKFDDGNSKALVEDFILSGCHTLLKGQSVYAMVEEKDEYESGIVTKLWMQNQKVRYEVEIDNGSPVVVSPEDLFLTEDQVKLIRENNPTKTPPGTPKTPGVVSLDNIVDGKRSTRSSRKVGTVNSPKPSGSGTRKLTPRRLDSDDERNTDAKSDSALEEVGGVEPELKMSTPIKTSKGPGKMKGQKRSQRLKLNDDLFNLDFGPIPEQGSEIFKKMSFLLVCARTPKSKEGDLSSDLSEGSAAECGDTDTEAMEFAKIPFHEEHLRQQIIAGGGTIYQHFEDIPTSAYKSCKLISNRPNRTAKYVQCVAAGMTIVCHEWIVRCCRDNKRVPLQDLPLGWSLERRKFIEAFDRKTTKPLKNSLVVLAPNSDTQFVKFWKRVCSLGGGSVVVMDSEEEDFQNATFVLTDNDCSEKVVDRALSWNIPLLSTVWVVQTIIHGEARAFDGHPRYAYDSIESD